VALPGRDAAIDSPEQLPVVRRANVQIRISWNATIEIRIFVKRPDQPRTDGIFEDVLHHVGESVVIPFLVVEHMIVSLSLPDGGQKCRTEMIAEEFDGRELIGVFAKSKPDQVQMVWHQHIGRAGEVVACGSVQQADLPILMKRFGQPAGGACLSGLSALPRRPSATCCISPWIAMSASQKRSSSRFDSLSVGSTISVPGTGKDIVGAWQP